MSKWKMTVTDVIDSENKCVIEIELDEDFEQGFLEMKRLKKWHHGKFKEWFKGILWRTLLSLEKGGYDTIYDRHLKSGDVKEARINDIISFWKESRGEQYGEHTRVVADVKKGVLITEPLWETDPAQKVSYKNVTRVVRKLS